MLPQLILGCSFLLPALVSAAPGPANQLPTRTKPRDVSHGAKLSAKSEAFVQDTVAWEKSTGYQWDKLAAEALLKLVGTIKQDGWPSDKCTLDDIYVRKEWSFLSKKERREYIDAVLCLQTRPSRLDPAAFPGAKNRYDDFVGVHISQTQNIHFSGSFLTWHRYYVWAYEWTLRNECGYKGYQPYINYAKYASDPLNSPIFDGSDTSMSGNGLNVTHGDINVFGVIIPPSNGGGCIYTGPLKNWSVNLGPAAPLYTDVPPNPRPDGLGYNPRCIRRDISQYVTSRWLKDEVIVELLTGYNDITSWQHRLQAWNYTQLGYLGVHGGGHFTTGADPGGDLFASPGDPYFFLHHASIDRLFWIWQNLSPRDRTYVVGDTLTLQNIPPSRNATLDDLLDLSVLGLAGVQTIRSASSTLGGSGSPFCYLFR